MFRNPRRWTGLLTLLAVLCLAALPSEPAWAEPRIALVIGNAAYPSAPLKNPANDASDMAAALKRLGFEVSLLKDASMQQMETAVREFGLKLRKGGTGLFYFAGHGLQVAGENYLVPVNAVIQSEGDVKYGCLNAGLVLAKMEDAGNGPNVVILDACRNNPFARSFRSAEAGLARMDAPTGSIIAYATAPGKVAADGEGRNGLYTQHLLRNIATPGLSISDLFMAVRENVVRDSAKKQVPWENTSLIGRFSLAGQPSAPVPVPAPQAALAPKPAPQPQAPLSVVPTPAAPAKLAQAPAPTPEEARAMQALREEWGWRKDVERVRKLARPLAARGSLYGKFVLGAMSDDRKEQFQAAAKAAEQGVPFAMFLHGVSLASRPVSAQDEIAGRELLRRASEQGEAGAKIEYADLLLRGKGGPKDVAEGEHLLEAAAREEPGYCLKLSYLYAVLAGDGVLPKADAEAKSLAYARRGADLGYVEAMRQTGHKYSELEKDREALYWFTMAGDKGDVHAMYQAAVIYLYGSDDGIPADQRVPENHMLAARWFRKAYDLGHNLSGVKLAVMTVQGQGVPKDPQRGMAMLKGLAEDGARNAQSELAGLLFRGQGVSRDPAEAYFWYAVADMAHGGSSRALVAKELTAEQRAAIEAKAAKWKPRPK